MTVGRTIAIIAALVFGVLLVMYDFNWQYATVVFIVLVVFAVVGLVYPGGS